MLELLIATASLVIGTFLGVWMRRSALADFERGVALGFTHGATYAKSQYDRPRHDNQPKPQNGPQDKK